MEGWEIALLVAAGYLAVAALARMMTARRQQLIKRYRAEMAVQRDGRSATPGGEAERKVT